MLDTENIAPVFGSDDIRFLSDDADLIAWLQENGLSAMSMEDLAEDPPENGVLAILTWEGDLPGNTSQHWGEALADSRVLHLPIGAFDGSIEAAMYTIEKTLRSDFRAASERCAAWANELRELGLDESLRFTGPATEVEVTLASQLSIGSRVQPQLNPGELVSALSYFEFGVESVDTGKANFSVDGAIDVAGMLVARDSTLPTELWAKWRIADELVQAMYQGPPPRITVTIERNHVRSIVVDGREMLPLFAELTNTAYEGKVLEFSIGTNQSIVGHADWSYNSLINEGHAGIHVAIGDGTTGPHIDFVCTDVHYAKRALL